MVTRWLMPQGGISVGASLAVQCFKNLLSNAGNAC